MRWILLLGTLLTSSACWGQTQCPYDLETGQETILLGTGAALGVTSLVLAAHVEPLSPAEIANLDLADVNAFDRNGVEPWRDTHDGDAMLGVSYAVPVTLLAASDPRRDWQTLAVMWSEAVLLQSGLNGVVKPAVQRPRPYAYDPAAPTAVKTQKSARLSFYSGHTAQAATNCFFAARVFSDYAQSRTAKILAWSGAALYPALVGYLRVASGHHFRTDVITGYCVGALAGVLVPQLHRISSAAPVQPLVVGAGSTDAIAGTCIGVLAGAIVPKLQHLRGMQHLRPAMVDGGIGVGLEWGAGARRMAGDSSARGQ